MTSGKINLMIAEDHILFSESLKLGLEMDGRFGQIYQAKNGMEAIEILKKEPVDIILMDILMPVCDGLKTSYFAKKHFPGTKIVMLTSMNDEKSVKLAFATAVDGYCLKEINLKSLIDVIFSVMAGNVWIDPAIARFVLQGFVGLGIGKQQPAETAAPKALLQTTMTPVQPAPRPPDLSRLPQVVAQAAPVETPKTEPRTSESETQEMPGERKNYFYAPFNKETPQEKTAPKAQSMPVHEYLIRGMPDPKEVLTEREIQILTMIAENKNNAEIVNLTGISEDWLNGYIRNILGKLSVDNEVQAVRRAHDEGMISNAPLLDDDMWL